MKTRDHYLLGMKIVKGLGKQVGTLQRKVFLFGCVEPDRNPFTYLRGSLRFQRFHGHNYENACMLIEKYIRELEAAGHWTIFTYYKLGKLIHYAADAFTFPHNSAFEETLKVHIQYEEKLHQQFVCCDTWEKFILKKPFVGTIDMFDSFQALHRIYLRERKDSRDDISYICYICKYFCSMLMKETQTTELELPVTLAS